MGLVMLNINEEAAILAVILNQIRYSLRVRSRPLNLSGGEMSLKIKGSQTQYKIFFFLFFLRKQRKGHGAVKKQTHRHVLQ